MISVNEKLGFDRASALGDGRRSEFVVHALRSLALHVQQLGAARLGKQLHTGGGFFAKLKQGERRVVSPA